MPLNPATWDKNAAPIIINAIIIVVFIVFLIEITKLSILRFLNRAAITKEPTTPKAAASVGVAKPRYMLPKTSKIKKNTGAMSFKDFNLSLHVYASSSFGTTLGLTVAAIMM